MKNDITDEDEAKLIDERLIQYAKCLKRTMCLESKIRGIASLMVSHPEYVSRDSQVITQSEDVQERIMGYELTVYLCDGEPSEKQE